MATGGGASRRRLVRIVALVHPLGNELEIIRHTTVAEGVGLHVVIVTASIVGTLDVHRAVVKIENVERSFAGTADAVFWIDAHGLPRAEGAECLSNIDKPAEPARVQESSQESVGTIDVMRDSNYFQKARISL